LAPEGKQACGKLSFVARPPDTGFFAHVPERIKAISSGQWDRIISERSELKAKLTIREEAHNDGLFDVSVPEISANVS
jgi:hypothetical protein